MVGLGAENFLELEAEAGEELGEAVGVVSRGLALAGDGEELLGRFCRGVALTTDGNRVGELREVDAVEAFGVVRAQHARQEVGRGGGQDGFLGRACLGGERQGASGDFLVDQRFGDASAIG